ncbi:hypothetical protein BHYA_0862g00020, partial [Botrytis hyacinthi]
MQLLTVVGAIAVLSNVVSAVPQPSEKIEQIQEKRWGWPWSTDSGKGGHGHGGGSWGSDDDNEDDDDDDDDSNTSIRSLLPFTHPRLVAEETGTSTTVLGTSFSTFVSSSSIASSSATNVLISGGGALSTTVSIISTVTDPILSATPIVIETSTSPSPTSTLSATLIIDNTSLTLCSALPTSIITVTESCTRTEWITVIESGSWTLTPFPSTTPVSVSASWTTTPSLPSGSPSGAVSSGGNSTGIWTVTPVQTSSRVWTTSMGNASVTSSSFSALETGTGSTTGWSVSAAPSVSGNSSSWVLSSLSSTSSLISVTSTPVTSTPATSTQESTSTTLLFSTTTIPYSSSSSSLSSSSISSPLPP